MFKNNSIEVMVYLLNSLQNKFYLPGEYVFYENDTGYC